MKNLLKVFVQNVGLFIGLIFFVAIIDLIGLGGKADIGLGFIFGMLVVIVVFILKYSGKWDKLKASYEKEDEI